MARTKLSPKQLKDLNITNPTDGQVLTYDSETQTWSNADPVGGSGGTGSGLESTESLVCDIDSDDSQTDALFKITKHGGTVELLRVDENGNLTVAGTIAEEGLDSPNPTTPNKSQIWARLFACM